MQLRNLKCGITGESFKKVQSRDIGHVQGIGNIQTNILQTSGAGYEEDSTKPAMEAEDWISDKPHQLESRMHKKQAEATSDIGEEESTNKNNKSIAIADLSSYTSTKPVAAGMQIPVCLQLPSRTIEMLQSAMRNPPVTVETLKELNLNWMTHYVNLRCDINFDHDLHFTPIKGSRGEEKRSQAVDYWIALEAEFRIYQHPSRQCPACESSGAGVLGMFQPRLSTMFQGLKELLQTLVPDKDHDEVAMNLDIDLITQQVEKGVLDVGRLSRWLAKLLKSHCAPMRDESAEAMAEKLEVGANNGDLSTLINGLESLFGFLEVMKLDVANHQIRTFRYVLIEETVAFQQSYFRKKIDDEKLDLAAAEAWYEQAYDRYISGSSIQATDHETVCFEVFLHGFVDLCTSDPYGQRSPITLHYDQGRMQTLRADVQDLVVLQLCIDVFNELLSRLRCRNHVPPLAYATLQNRLLTIAEEETAHSGFIPWSEKSAEIATEITRAAFVASFFPHPPRIPAGAFDHTHARVQEVFENCYAAVEAEVLSRLAEETIAHASVFQKMSMKDISETQKMYQQQRQGRGDLELSLVVPDMENMSRMLAHMGVIHWQVWRDLAYVKDEEGEGLGLRDIYFENPDTDAFDRDGGFMPEGGGGGFKAGIEKQIGRACDNN